MKQITTSSGMNLLLRGLAGATINFTKIKFGNGEEQGVTAIDLSNPIMELPITSITREANYITLETSYKNADVPTDFSAHEIGVFATDPDDETKEICYCLWYEEDPVKADYISAVEDRILGTKFEFLVFVDTVENVTAILAESAEYATQAALTQHTSDTTNPHKVTKIQVGLGNVPNVTPENQKPVFSNVYNSITVTSSTDTAGNTLKKTAFANIVSGERMGSILQKIRTAFYVLLTHLSSSNPHSITAKLIGAAEKNHYHSANQINTGTLGIKRGGTGGTTAAAARENLGIKAGQFSFELVAGETSIISFEFNTPYADGYYPYITATPMKGVQQDLEFGIRGFSPTGFEVFAYSPTYSGAVTFNWIACL